MPAPRRDTLGFSLIELLTLLAIITIVALMAIPGFSEIAKQNKLTAAINEFSSVHRIARSEAVVRGRPISVCVRHTDTEGAPACSATGDWHAGWVAFVNEDDDDPAMIDPDETVLHVSYPLTPGMTLTGADGVARHVTYRPTGDIATGVAFVLCDNGQLTRSRLLEIVTNGRITVAPRSASGVPVRGNEEIDSCDP